MPAAFRRLCVETQMPKRSSLLRHPAAFRRLCVETLIYGLTAWRIYPQPPLGGCVLKPALDVWHSRFEEPAAFRRLCVETYFTDLSSIESSPQPPLGGCVLKPHKIDSGGYTASQPPLGGCVLKLLRLFPE